MPSSTIPCTLQFNYVQCVSSISNPLSHILSLSLSVCYRIRQKPKLVVALVKGPEFDVVMEQEEKDAAERAAKRAAAEAAANGEGKAES